MSCPVDQESLDRLKGFLDLCKNQPDILHLPQISFFKNFIESFGGKVPEPRKMSTETQSEPEEQHQESEVESEIELDMTGCIDPDKLEDNQKMGDPSKEVSEEDSDRAEEKRNEALSEFSEGNYEKAIELFNEAIELNPHSALLFAKRGQVYLKLNKPNACIKDCTKALELNPDSAAAYKHRGRSYRLLGEWELAAKDLRQACNIDFDEQTDEWLREVTPNAKKIEEHQLKQERIKKEKEEKDKLEKIRKAREAFNQAASAQEKPAADIPTAEGGGGGVGGMEDFYKLLQDPEIMAAFEDPEISAAFQDMSMNPSNFSKYQSNPKIMTLLSKLSGKFAGSGINFPGIPTAGGGFPGGATGGKSAPPPGWKFSEDNLD